MWDSQFGMNKLSGLRGQQNPGLAGGGQNTNNSPMMSWMQNNNPELHWQAQQGWDQQQRDIAQQPWSTRSPGNWQRYLQGQDVANQFAANNPPGANQQSGWNWNQQPQQQQFMPQMMNSMYGG